MNAASTFQRTNLQSFNDSVSLAKQAPNSTIVILIGKLIVVNKEYYLQDSTDKIELTFFKEELKRAPSKVGQDIEITGRVTKGFWYSIGFKDVSIKVNKIEIYQGAM